MKRSSMWLTVIIAMLACSFCLFGEELEKSSIDFEYDAGSVRVIDGDTIHVDVNVTDCPAVICKDLPIRVSGIDTPEIHSKNTHEHDLAVMAKNELITFLSRGEFYLHHCSRDKFFRVDCHIMDENQNDYSDYIISKRLAVPYQGEKKTYDWSTHHLQ